MIKKEIILTESDAELLSRVLAEVKTTLYKESEHRANDTEALEALIYCFRNATAEHYEYLNLLAKRAWVKNGNMTSDEAYPLFLY